MHRLNCTACSAYESRTPFRRELKSTSSYILTKYVRNPVFYVCQSNLYIRCLSYRFPADNIHLCIWKTIISHQFLFCNNNQSFPGEFRSHLVQGRSLIFFSFFFNLKGKLLIYSYLHLVQFPAIFSFDTPEVPWSICLFMKSSGPQLARVCWFYSRCNPAKTRPVACTTGWLYHHPYLLQ